MNNKIFNNSEYNDLSIRITDNNFTIEIIGIEFCRDKICLYSKIVVGSSLKPGQFALTWMTDNLGGNYSSFHDNILDDNTIITSYIPPLNPKSQNLEIVIKDLWYSSQSNVSCIPTDFEIRIEKIWKVNIKLEKLNKPEQSKIFIANRYSTAFLDKKLEITNLTVYPYSFSLEISGLVALQSKIWERGYISQLFYSEDNSYTHDKEAIEISNYYQLSLVDSISEDYVNLSVVNYFRANVNGLCFDDIVNGLQLYVIDRTGRQPPFSIYISNPDDENRIRREEIDDSDELCGFPAGIN